MQFISKYFVILTLALCSMNATASPSRQGGVSDGGGGALDPSPVSPQQIAEIVPQLSSFVLPWLYQKEMDFLALPAEEQITSPLKKLFPTVGKNILDLAEKTPYEVRLTTPCLDAKGQPQDASIYSKKAGMICLSAFRLSKKLTKGSVNSEVAALIIHELSHLLGTSETEAVEIQKLASTEFNEMTLKAVRLAQKDLIDGEHGGLIDFVISPLTPWMQDPKNLATARDVIHWFGAWGGLRENISHQPLYKLQFARRSALVKYTPYNMKIAVIMGYLNAHDQYSTAAGRKDAQEILDRNFAAGKIQTARAMTINLEGWDPGPEYDLVVLRKPESWKHIAADFTELRDYLGATRDHLIKVYSFQLVTELTP